MVSRSICYYCDGFVRQSANAFLCNYWRRRPMRVPLRGDSQLARFLPRRVADRSQSVHPVRPRPATSIPAGGSKMHSFNMKKIKDLLIFLVT